MRLPEDVPACTRMDEDVPEAARRELLDRQAAYARSWKRAHLAYRVREAARKREKHREKRAGLRPGGGCVKCELREGCGGLFCDRADRKRPG